MKAVIGAMAMLAAAGAVAPALAETITCGSDNGRERFCPVNTRGGVWLETQLSASGCYQGDTWGYDRQGVWVSGGCRAVFRTGGYSGYNPYQGNNYYDRGYDDRYRGDPRYSENRHKGDGAAAAVALGAILATAAVASAASKNRSSGNASWNDGDRRGCDAGRADRRAGQSQSYWRHGDKFDSRSEQAFQSGYDRCWQDR